jgi:hypothetical protein
VAIAGDDIVTFSLHRPLALASATYVRDIAWVLALADSLPEFLEDTSDLDNGIGTYK